MRWLTTVAIGLVTVAAAVGVYAWLGNIAMPMVVIVIGLLFACMVLALADEAGHERDPRDERSYR